jgi:SAM-dependent methyltransferase
MRRGEALATTPGLNCRCVHWHCAPHRDAAKPVSLKGLMMKQEHLKYLACPRCAGELTIAQIDNYLEDSIENGLLQCSQCKDEFKILRHIPRFVPMENYASGFGFQWNKHDRTQYDSYSGVNISEKRFFDTTKWSRNLSGQIILEVGSGSGRFTEQAALTGGMVLSLDYSHAVEANYASNGHRNNVLIAQGDIYSMPFKQASYDKLFCIGVLQHTSSVERAFLSLPKFLKPGGSLVIDIYRYRWWKYWLTPRYRVRPLTKRLPTETLYEWCERYVDFMWSIARWININVPQGRHINQLLLLIADFRGSYPLSEEMLKQWSTLDMFDCLSPIYDSPQTLRNVKKWFEKSALEQIDIHYGHNGIVGCAIKSI